MTAPQPPFPCPFCQSSRVTLVGGGLVFLHYKCTDCAEVWTAMSAARPSVLRPRSSEAARHALPMFGTFETADDSLMPEHRSKDGSAGPDLDRRGQKVWRH